MTERLSSIGLHAALLGGVVSFSAIFFAIALTPEFDWKENYLSDLAGKPGEKPYWNARGPPSIIFNAGLFLGGLAELLFAWELRKTGLLAGKGKTAWAALALAAVFISLIGVFPETLGLPHEFAALGFFLLVPVTAFLAGKALRDFDAVLSRWLFTASTVSLSSAIGVMATPAYPAAFQLVTAACMAVLVLALAFKAR